MPNIKSAKKRVKTNLRDEARNRQAKATLRTTLKSAIATIDGGDKTEAAKATRSTQMLIARTAKRGVIHKNKAARLQSRVMKRASKTSQE